MKMKPVKYFIVIWLILLFITGTSGFINAQNIENADFDSVFTGGIDRIYNWITSDSWYINAGDTAMPLDPFTHYISVGLDYHMAYSTVLIDYSTPYAGYAAILKSLSGAINSLGEPFPGFIINGNHFYTGASGYPDVARCGAPFPYRPSRMKGYYKFEDTTVSLPRRGKALILLKKYNDLTGLSDTIGYVSDTSALTVQQDWTPFEIPIDYQNTAVPDSIVVAFFATSSGTNPGTLWLDEISFEFDNQGLVHFNTHNWPGFFPNSTGESAFLISDSQVAKIEIWDMTGRLILKYIIHGTGIVPFGQLSAGCYLAIICFNDATICRQKILKQ